MADNWINFRMQKSDRMKVLSFRLVLSTQPEWEELEGRVETLEQLAFSASPVQSVFGRIGDVVADGGDYAAFYDPKGSALAVQSNLNTHLNDFDDPHETKAALQTYVASNTLAAQDEDGGLYTVLSTDVDKFLNLSVTATYEDNDIVSFRVELPVVTGNTGNASFLLEMVFDKGGPEEIVIASQTEYVGNNTITINTTIQGIVDSIPGGSVGPGLIGLYASGINGTITIDGSTGTTNFLLASRTRNFSFKAYPP